MLCSTSGTTSNPKLASLASGRFIPHVATYCDLLGLGPDDEYVSLLPMGWIGEQFQALYQPLVCRHKINFVEEPDTVMADLREIAPTFMFLAPRVWEQIAANVRAQIMDASRFKRCMFTWGVKRGLKAVERGRTSWLAQTMVLRALRDRLGFTRLRFASTGGAPMGPDTFKFFMAMGLPMLQLYGQTELGGIYCIQRRGEVDFDTVGRGFNDDYKIRIDNPDAQGVGEIVSQHPYMFEGYYKNEAATRADLREGWMHTGDAGYFKPSGQLVVIDRMRDLADLVVRRALLAAIHREQAQVLALRQRGGGARRPARLSRRDRVHPFPDRLQVGRAEPHVVHDLLGPCQPPPGLQPDRR